MSQKAEKDRDIRFEDNPIHTGVTKDTASTPGYFRLLLPWAMGRYIFRFFVESSPNIISDLKRAGVKGVVLGKPGPILQDLEQLTNDAVTRFNQNSGLDRGATIEEMLVSPLGKRLQNNLEDHGVNTSELGEIIEKSAARVVDDEKDSMYGNRMKTLRDDISKKVTGNSISRAYDYGLGTGSLFMTGYYANRVASDIKKVFAETVAYELEKDPKDISYRDIWNSQNHLVKEVRSNFIHKNIGRVGSDLIFFGGALAHVPRMGFLKKYSFSDLGVGVKGAQLVGEMLNKHSTIFEDLIQLIDNKMNPLKGLGAPITVGDTFDLYQKYTQIHDPKATFRDALSGQNHDGRDWPKAQAIFKRVTELMNLTYKYKHIGRQPSETEQLQADFALPKFLYLLGNGMIDTYKPEETMAYVEVANAYGIPAVRQLQRALERGIPVEQALTNYPHDLRHAVMSLQAGSDKTPAAQILQSPNSSIAQPLPSTTVHAASEVALVKASPPSIQMGAV